MELRKIAKLPTVMSIAMLMIASFLVYSSGLSGAAAQITYPVPREESFVMVWAEFRVFDSFNPFIPHGVQWGGGWHQLVQEWIHLVDVYTNETLWWIATGYEFNEDYTQYTLHIRPGVKWNDGVPYTVNDIVFTINMNINYSIGDFAGLADTLESMEAPDDYTLVLNFKEPDPRFSFRGKPDIVPEHIWKDKDPMMFKNNPPVGTGPYVLYKVLPDAQMFIWVRDEDWWGTEVFGLSPGPKYVISKTGEEFDIAVPQLIRGDIDYGPAMNGLRVYETVSQATSDFKTITTLEAGCFGYFINSHSTKYPLNMTDFRRAISYCINTEKIASLYPLPGGGTVARFYWPEIPSIQRFLPEEIYEQYGVRYDSAMAAQMLDDLNYMDINGDGWRETPDGQSIAIEITTPPDDEFRLMAIDWAEELKEVGIDAVVRQVGGALWWDLVSVGDYDIAAGGVWVGVTPDTGDIYGILELCSTKYVTPIGEGADHEITATYYNNPELDPIVEQLATMAPTDPDALPLYHQGLSIIMRDLPIIPVTLPTRMDVVSTKYWTGWPGPVTVYPPHHTVGDILLNLRSAVAPPTPVSYITVYLTEDIAAFTGVDGETYGPYESGDVAFLPKDDAEELIVSGKASLASPDLPIIAEAISELASDVTGLKTDVADVKSATQDLSSNIGSISTLTYASIGLNVIVLILVAVLLVRKRS